MNKFTKLILTTAVFATSGFAATEMTTISGTENIKEGASYEVQNNDCTLTGTMTLAGSEADGNAAKLIIDADRTLDIQGGTLTYDEQGTYKPEIALNGTMKLSKNGEINPTVKLDNVEINGGGILTIGTENYIITGITELYGQKVISTIDEWNNERSFIELDRIYFNSTQKNISGWKSLEEYPNWYTTLYSPDIFLTYSAESLDSTTLFDSMFCGGEFHYSSGTQMIFKYGALDMSALREYSVDAKSINDLSANISGIKPTALGTAKLPFNCKFSNVDLSNVDNVEYTKLSVGESSAPGVDENGIIKKVITQAAATYGDYKNDKSLGVTTTSDGTKQDIAGNQEQLRLIELTANKEKYNKTSLKLYTNDLDDVAMTISEDTTYNFGFQGTGSISITGDFKAIFAGDNSEYAPADDSLTLPSTVEFAGDSSLFSVTQTYGKGIFSGEFTNEIPAGKTVTFTNGMNLESNHTLNVKGKLIV